MMEDGSQPILNMRKIVPQYYLSMIIIKPSVVDSEESQRVAFLWKT